MLNKITIKNFKRLEEEVIPLGFSTVFIGPNNSGKTSALQAISLWNIGLQQWNEKRKNSRALKRPGCTINRKNILSAPVPDTKLLWRNLNVRKGAGHGTQNVRIGISIEGIHKGKTWECGLEFDFTNEESFVCRPMRLPGYENEQVEKVTFSEIPEEALGVNVAYLPPMSGLAATEFRKEKGEINVMIGEGQTAQVLRNLCFQIFQDNGGENWKKIVDHIDELFGVKLLEPEYHSTRSELRMNYRETGGVILDISSAGRGLQQTLLLLANLYANPGSILLLDEPDAHLEILRQRQIYQLINTVALNNQSQIIMASHSEVILNEAADRDVVIAFVGKPHRIDDRGSQVLKSLKDIGFEDYFMAEMEGWVLYLEGSTDFAVLQSFAKLLNHEAGALLAKPFVKYVGNNSKLARSHFFGLSEACPDLVGVSLFDGDEQVDLKDHSRLIELKWAKREIENYFCTESVLLKYAKNHLGLPLFEENAEKIMLELIRKTGAALKILGKPSPWSSEIKASDDFLKPLFMSFSAELNIPNDVLRKTDFYKLADLLSPEDVSPEIKEKLNAIVRVAKRAKPKK